LCVGHAGGSQCGHGKYRGSAGLYPDRADQEQRKMMMIMAGIFGVVLMAVLGTYYFRNKKRHRKTALLCKALATSVSGLLLLGYLYGERTGGAAGAVLSGWADGVIREAAFAGTLAAIVFYMAADVL